MRQHFPALPKLPLFKSLSIISLSQKIPALAVCVVAADVVSQSAVFAD